LLDNKIENRPIVSGNFVRQPALKKLGLELKPEDYKGAEIVNNFGFFIGLHATLIDEEIIIKVADILMSYDFEN
jgi:hypothetical protein